MPTRCVGPGGERSCPDGRDCYRAAYVATLAACGAGLVVTLLVIRHQHHARLREDGKAGRHRLKGGVCAGLVPKSCWQGCIPVAVGLRDTCRFHDRSCLGRTWGVAFSLKAHALCGVLGQTLDIDESATSGCEIDATPIWHGSPAMIDWAP